MLRMKKVNPSPWERGRGEGLLVEVLIVGAGPAGAIAALMLARAGVRVLVVDRARFPRDKLCGDTLNPGSLAMLARHGVTERILARGKPIEGMLVTGAPDVKVRGLYSGGLTGRSLTRRELDQQLIEAAVAAGARFQDGVRVASPIVEESAGVKSVRGATLVTSDRRPMRVPALVTIAADGRRSPLAFALGLARQPAWPRRWALGGYMTGVTGLDTVGEMHIRRGHYIGVAPLPDGLTNVCYVSPHPRIEGADMGRMLLSHVREDPMLRDRFTQATIAGPVTMMGPLAVDVPVAGMQGLLLAGDAAGFVDPMTGDGLRFAIRGAELAADVAQQCLEESSFEGFRTLTARRAREFGVKYRFNRGLRGLVSSDTGVRAGTLGAKLAPAVLRRIIRYAGDEPLAR
jgi:flavin-dependent dehydrogenase